MKHLAPSICTNSLANAPHVNKKPVQTDDERCTRNVIGKAGKQQLPPNRTEAVKKVVFSQLPLEVWENERNKCLGRLGQSYQ